MSIPGYVEYQRREYCKDIRCPAQRDLEREEAGSAAYESVRDICKKDCKHTTYEFHHWLIQKGYLIVRPESKGS